MRCLWDMQMKTARSHLNQSHLCLGDREREKGRKEGKKQGKKKEKLAF